MKRAKAKGCVVRVERERSTGFLRFSQTEATHFYVGRIWDDACHRAGLRRLKPGETVKVRITVEEVE